MWFDIGQFYPCPSVLLHWHWGNLMIPPSAIEITLYNMGKYIKSFQLEIILKAQKNQAKQNRAHI